VKNLGAAIGEWDGWQQRKGGGGDAETPRGNQVSGMVGRLGARERPRRRKVGRCNERERGGSIKCRRQKRKVFEILVGKVQPESAGVGHER